MTTALCLRCGETKFGAFCLCPACAAPATGDHNIDIAFSDHRIPLANLKKLGDVIREINATSDDPDTRFWTFISYISNNHNELLSATPPQELIDSVEEILSSTQLPTCDLQLMETPEDEGPPTKTIELPKAMFDRYAAQNKFHIIASVQIRDSNSKIHAATLIVDNGPLLICPEDSPLTVETISAIRKSPGCLIGWLVKPKWIESNETSHSSIGCVKR